MDLFLRRAIDLPQYRREQPDVPDIVLDRVLSVDTGSLDAENKVTICGAGAIGRGLLAPLIAGAGFRLSFTDVSPALIAALRASNSYEVNIGGETVGITDLHLINSGTNPDEAVAEMVRSCMICSAIGAKYYMSLARPLADALYYRMLFRINDPVNVVMLENLPLVFDAGYRAMEDPLAAFKAKLVEHRPGIKNFIENNVGIAMAIGNYPAGLQGGTDLLHISVAGSGHIIPVDAAGLKGPTGVPQLAAVDNFVRQQARKLLMFNMLHALVAYLGLNYRTITRGNRPASVPQAMGFSDIRIIFENALDEISGPVEKHFGFPAAEMELYRSHILNIFRTYPDLLDRVGADPFRKLNRFDRLVGAAFLCAEYGVKPEAIAQGIAAGIRYAIETVGTNPDPEKGFPPIIHSRIDKFFWILDRKCRIEAHSALGKSILSSFTALEANCP